MSEEAPSIPGFRSVPKTGVIYVTSEAAKRGFSPTADDWCNLGQGQPEIGPLVGAPDRRSTVEINLDDHEYAPVAGLWELRAAVADHYNRRYRRGLRSQYSAENVAISSGGRSALTRAAASLGRINLGHFLPDYTAYEELLDIFKAFTAIPILLDPGENYEISIARLRQEIEGRGLSAILLSNPNNPMGKHIHGEELQRWVETARDCACSLLIDEFYSHYLWHADDAGKVAESAACYVEDVDSDPIVLFDGLTKNWRYPGWRVAWTIGPKAVIEAVASAGSFLDGGGSRPLQRAAVEFLDSEHVTGEIGAMRRTFLAKKDLLLRRLRAMGVTVEREPEATFYIWGSLRDLPPPLDDGIGFFEAALDSKVIVVPGDFFDVNPGRRRAAQRARFRQHARFSFGPPMETIERACDRLDDLVTRHRR